MDGVVLTLIWCSCSRSWTDNYLIYVYGSWLLLAIEVIWCQLLLGLGVRRPAISSDAAAVKKAKSLAKAKAPSVAKAKSLAKSKAASGKGKAGAAAKAEGDAQEPEAAPAGPMFLSDALSGARQARHLRRRPLGRHMCLAGGWVAVHATTHQWSVAVLAC